MKNLREMVHSIALVGIDGSGKSTQSEKLSQLLIQNKQQVFRIHPFGWKLVSFLSPGSKSRLIEWQGRIQSENRSKLGRQLIAWAEVLDIGIYIAVSTLRCYIYALINREEVWLVSDRSFEDLLIKHSRLHTISRHALESLRHFVPKIDQTVWLKTDPQTAMQRDADFPASYYEELHCIYQEAAERNDWKIVPTADRSREAVFNDLLDKLGLGILEDDEGRLIMNQNPHNITVVGKEMKQRDELSNTYSK